LGLTKSGSPFATLTCYLFGNIVYSLWFIESFEEWILKAVFSMSTDIPTYQCPSIPLSIDEGELLQFSCIFFNHTPSDKYGGEQQFYGVLFFFPECYW